MQTLNIKKMLDIAETVAKRAAMKLLQNVGSLKQVDCDFSRDVKVKADKFLDEIIRKQLEKKTDFPVISEETIDHVGYPIILDAWSNMAFGALLLSTIIPLAQIGGLMIFAMLSTSIGALTLLASALEIFKLKMR